MKNNTKSTLVDLGGPVARVEAERFASGRVKTVVTIISLEAKAIEFELDSDQLADFVKALADTSDFA